MILRNRYMTLQQGGNAVSFVESVPSGTQRSLSSFLTYEEWLRSGERDSSLLSSAFSSVPYLCLANGRSRKYLHGLNHGLPAVSRVSLAILRVSRYLDIPVGVLAKLRSAVRPPSLHWRT